MTDFDLVPTDELITELANRHTELIVIRDRKNKKNEERIFVKTPLGAKSKQEKKYDLLVASDMLTSAQNQLIWDYLDDVEERET